MEQARVRGTGFQTLQIEEYVVEDEPFYMPLGNEIELFEAAYLQKIPVLLKGPTGCGKTRFVEHMAHRLSQPSSVRQQNGAEARSVPLVTVACHEDLTASDLVGRYLIDAEGTRWIDGPLTRAVKVGAICYLDEIVETRKDTTVLIHPLTDHRRILPIEKQGLLMEANDGFLLVISYNPGYQSALKDLKHSTRQRFVSLEFDYPPPDIEGEDPGARGWRRSRNRHEPGQARREDSQPEGPRPAGGFQHPFAHLRGQAHESGRRRTRRMPGGHRVGAVR